MLTAWKIVEYLILFLSIIFVIIAAIIIITKYRSIKSRINLSLIYTLFYFIIVIIVIYFAYTKGFKHRVNGSGIKFVQFDSLEGPLEKTVIVRKVKTKFNKFAQGKESRLAILLTDPSAPFWLGLAQGLKSIGIPFIITDDYREALKHKVIFVYPGISNRIPATGLKELARVPSSGGTLITQNISVGTLMPVFGIAGSKSTNKLHKIRLNSQSEVTRNFTEPEEQNIQIGNLVEFSTGEVIYLRPTQTLASYENGSAAIVQKNYPNNGHAYAIGINIGRLSLIGYAGRQSGISPFYANHYVPTIDVFLRLLKNIYVAGQKNAVTINTVPDNKSLTVLITHDLCFSEAYTYLQDYADYEYANNIKATYYVTTKYAPDFLDIAYFNEPNIQILKSITEMGMALGSHSVSHPLDFNTIPLGTGKEEYPSYKPQILSGLITKDASILGELRVSHFLLQHFFPNLEILSFRPGYLRNPWALPESLAATGYKFSSSVTANDSLTHLPFQLNYDRDFSTEAPVFEFPITIEDMEVPDKYYDKDKLIQNYHAEKTMYDHLPQAINIANSLMRYGGLFVILIHPNNLDQQKLRFEKEFVEQVGENVWYGTINDFGKWWEARNELGVDVENDRQNLVITLNAPIAIKDLTLTIPPYWRYSFSEPESIDVDQDDQQIVIDKLNGNVRLHFTYYK